MTKSFSIVIVTGSPVALSRTVGLAQLVERRLSREGFRVSMLHVRDLPAEALFHADFDHPKIKAAVRSLAGADGVVMTSPVYKAAYTGMLKAFIDILPQSGLRDKVVLPLLVGGTLAHVLAIDYAVRPMLQSLDPRLIVGGLFILDKTIEFCESGAMLSPDVAVRLEQVTQTFIDGLRAHDALTDVQAMEAAESIMVWSA